MAMFRVHLFGKFRVWCGDQMVEGLDARKVQELFTYLLLHRDRSHARETLATLMWGDNPTSLSRKLLRQGLWQLQTALHSHSEPTDPRILLAEPDWVQFNIASDVWIDVARFEESFALTHRLSGEQLDEQRLDSLKQAVDLYQGDLLEGWYQDWCLYERERLQNMYLIMLDQLMGYCEVHREYEAGMDYGARILQLDRASERAHQRLMRLLYLAGDRSAALRQYERCIVALREELGVKPGKGTVALYEQIHQDQLEGFQVAPTSLASTGFQSHLDEILQRLKQFQSDLGDLHQQVQEEIRVIEAATKGQVRKTPQ